MLAVYQSISLFVVRSTLRLFGCGTTTIPFMYVACFVVVCLYESCAVSFLPACMTFVRDLSFYVSSF